MAHRGVGEDVLRERGTSRRFLDSQEREADAFQLHEKIALPVAEKMLDVLAERKSPRGFKAPGFVKDCFEETFGKHLNHISAASEGSKSVPEFSVVDVAVGLLSYNVPMISDIKKGYLVDMLTSLVQSNVSCGSHHMSSWECPSPHERSKFFQGQKMFHGHLCGRQITTNNLLQIVESCKAFFVSAEDNGTQVLEVVDSLVKVATGTCLFTPRSKFSKSVFNKTIYGIEGQIRKDPAWALQSVIDYAISKKDAIYSKLRPFSRLQFWRIQPMCLRQDISCIVRESLERLLLPLDRELCQREEWATVVVCLSLAPDIFTEARRILHIWFISTGAIRLWELRAEMVTAVYDVLKRPSVWGVTEGVQIPPPRAFHSTLLRPFVQILQGAPTLVGIVKLVKLLDHAENLHQQSVADSSMGSKREGLGTTLYEAEVKMFRIYDQVDHNSVWALLIDFLPWFYFALRILFRNSLQSSSENFHGEVPELFTSQPQLDNGSALTGFAARYVAYIVNPIDPDSRVSHEKMLRDLSSSWDKVLETLSLDDSPGLSDVEDPRTIQVAVQQTVWKCSKCGIPVHDVKRYKRDQVGDLCDRTNDKQTSQRESIHKVDLWLADLQMKFGRTVQKIHSKGGKCFGGEADLGQGVPAAKSCMEGTTQGTCSSSNHSARGKAVVLVYSIPLAALVESLKICNHDIVIRLLEFVCTRGDPGPLEELIPGRRGDDGCSELPACNSCATVHCELCCTQESTRHATDHVHGRLGAISKASQQRRHVTSENWISGAAAIFRFLDSLDGDVLSQTDAFHPDFDCTAEKGRVTNNMVLIIAEFINQWGIYIETQVSSGVLSKVCDKNSYLQLLQDLQTRFHDLIGKLNLSTEVRKICREALGLLDVRIKNVKSLQFTV